MKKSRIAVLGALVCLVLMIVVIIVFVRVFIGSRLQGHLGDSSNTALVKEDLELSGFDSVVIEGVWKLNIVQGPEFKVEIEYPEQLVTL